MRGSHEVKVTSGRVQFKITANRNLTLLKGDSATGKTTLVDMIADFEEMGPDSGVTVSCDVPCTVLSGRNWEKTLAAISGSIVFIDEGNSFVASQDFAHAARHSDNYYVIVSRETLPMLPYSVDEIYGLRNNTKRQISKYPSAYRIYSSAYRIYNEGMSEATRPELVIVEDGGAGFDFFSALCAAAKIPCESAHGKTNVFQAVRDSCYDNILVIADGAAFGPEIERVLSLRYRKNVRLYLPESFEWLILKSGLVDGAELQKLLEDPAPHIESRDFFSWEQFFTSVLKRLTQDTYLAYSKGELNPAYLNKRELDAITSNMPKLWD